MSERSRSLAVIGAGAFGTALACVYGRAGLAVTLLDRNAERAAMAEETRRSVFLPDITLPDQIRITARPERIEDCPIVLCAAPAQRTRETLQSLRDYLVLDAALVLCAKGVERESLALQTEIASQTVPSLGSCVLTGPGFASEIAQGLPTALALAHPDPEAGQALQKKLSTPTLRLYLTDDLTGAQLGGAMKNVIAIACGIAMGADLGESARAALLTRGMSEMTRLAARMGAKAETLAGLSGLGDLALTCASARSRNFALGVAIGQQTAPAAALSEGASTAAALTSLAEQLSEDLPISETVANIVSERITVEEAVERLLSRPLRRE